MLFEEIPDLACNAVKPSNVSVHVIDIRDGDRVVAKNAEICAVGENRKNLEREKNGQ